MINLEKKLSNVKPIKCPKDLDKKIQDRIYMIYVLQLVIRVSKYIWFFVLVVSILYMAFSVIESVDSTFWETIIQNFDVFKSNADNFLAILFESVPVYSMIIVIVSLGFFIITQFISKINFYKLNYE